MSKIMKMKLTGTTVHVLRKTAKDKYEVAMIKGGGTYNGIHFPPDEITQDAADTFAGEPVNLDHSDLVADEVGFVTDPWADPEAVLRATLTLNPKTERYDTATAFIENRLAAGKVPEVSVGVYMDVAEETDPENPKQTRLVARNLRGDHLALVTRGACSPGDGCGIGLSENPEVHQMCEKDNEKMKELRERIDALESENAELAGDLSAEAEALETVTAELQTYQEQERSALVDEAKEFDIEVSDDTDLAMLRRDVALAKRVAEKYASADKPEEPPKRKAKATAGNNDKPSATAEAARLVALGMGA